MHVRIGTAQDVDQLAVRAKAAGISLDADPHDTPWNSRTFRSHRPERLQTVDLVRGVTHMLRDTDAIADLTVKDLIRAKEFYEGVLGFEPGQQAPRGLRTSHAQRPAAMCARTRSTASEVDNVTGTMPRRQYAGWSALQSQGPILTAA